VQGALQGVPLSGALIGSDTSVTWSAADGVTKDVMHAIQNLSIT